MLFSLFSLSDHNELILGSSTHPAAPPGSDRKPFPPAMKISRDMSEAMGGAKGVLCHPDA